MKRSTDRILTTHPGRLPDPSVRDAVMQARESGDRATFESLTKQGIGEMVSLQREAGVDIMSDGEFWKARDQLYYGSRATGIEARPLAPGEWPSLLGTHEERMGTRFAEFFASHATDVNLPLAAGDPVVDQTTTTGAPLPGPFAGSSINCRLSTAGS